MPIWLITLVPKVLPFLKSKASLIIGAALVAGMAGWTVNGWRLDSKYESERADRQAAVATALATQQRKMVEKMKAQRRAFDAINSTLAQNIDTVHARNSALRAEIDTQPLTKTVTCDVTGDDTNDQMELQNPFSERFVDIWNRAGDGVRID